MKKILVVDDEAIYTLLLKRALTDEGYRVETAARGEEAIEKGTRMAPDLVLCDWTLKDDVNGLQVTAALRKAQPSLKVILITGLSDPGLRTQARDAGVMRLLQKPVSLDETLAAVQEALAG